MIHFELFIWIGAYFLEKIFFIFIYLGFYMFEFFHCVLFSRSGY